jgi:8-oxo-dGTP pyrophosphatase MutT (NUDIX family)
MEQFPSWDELELEYGSLAREHYALAVDPGFAEYMVMSARKRVGEAVLLMRRPDRQILLHTKPFYPPGTWRVPSGGVKPGETPSEAAVREIAEETGLPAELEGLLGVLTYELTGGAVVVPYASYLFSVATPGGEPVPQDSKEQITGFRWIATSELNEVAVQLRDLSPPWKSWGEFRALAHEFFARVVR